MIGLGTGEGEGVGVGVGVGVAVGLTVGVGITTEVGVGDGVDAGVTVGVGVGVGAGVAIDTLQSFGDKLLFRGFGVLVEKSAVLSFVSMQPFPARKSAVVLLSAGAWVDPSKQSAVAPYPMKSIVVLENGQPLPLNAVVLLTSATLAAVADRFALPAASGVGKSLPLVPPDPSCTRK
jgi:hypothetical protein